MIRTLVLAVALLAAAPAFAEGPATKASPAAAPSTKMAPEAQRLDLNSATMEQLLSVRGFNKSVAEAIVKARPFKSVEDLTAKKIVSSDVLGPVKDQLIVR
ncbi:helix-hairpin-helix domain-containing protein [Methylocystis sp. IM3]|jgi:competence protein ComEA|uniref:ComEA family DNA-binding protein n=2 Tax=Methylocystis TaxID=133 RepID=UPI000FC23C05|nr:MAG: helix-hairpin-helix domain-containing protein [Hyphomicrobiales bacterium]